MRIVAGTAKGRALEGPKGQNIRPTADQVRESLFNILGQWLDGQKVLDLYAGTGALALEAISRGAVSAVLVDRDREALGLCRKNAESLGFEAQVRILGMPVSRAVQTLGKEGASFDLIFADPPYAAEAITEVLEQVAANKLLAPGGTLVFEHDRHESAPEAHAGLMRIDSRAFGQTRVSLFRSADVP